METKKFVLAILTEFGLIILGLIVLLSTCLYLAISSPIFLYRLILCTLVKPFYSDNIVSAVNPQGAALATEFLKSKSHLPPRSTIVFNTVVEGTVDLDSIITSLTDNWINGKTSKGELKLQQYIEEWMGFMFWKKDKNFDLNNHIYFHTIPSAESFDYSKKFQKQLTEDLLNRPYQQHRSPWELHVIHNYKEEELMESTSEEFCTLFTFRFHHAIADGFSLMNLCLEGFCQTSLQKISRKNQNPTSQNNLNISKDTIFTKVKWPIRFLRDLGFLISPAVLNEKSPFYIEDRNKSWKQIHSKSPLIPLEKVKAIRKRFGVTFSSVLISAISSATGRYLIDNSKFQTLSNHKINFVTLLPLPNHPYKLTNHATAGILEIDMNITTTNVIERLRKCNQSFVGAAYSTIPSGIIPFGVKILGLNLAPICSYLSYIRWVSTGLSSFPVSCKPFLFKERSFLTGHVAVGCGPGVTGLGFQVFGYYKDFRLVAVAENALMSNKELQYLVGLICEEIDNMYEISEGMKA